MDVRLDEPGLWLTRSGYSGAGVRPARDGRAPGGRARPAGRASARGQSEPSRNPSEDDARQAVARSTDDVTNPHFETIRKLEHIALVRDTFERHVELERPVAVLYDYDAELKHRGQRERGVGKPRSLPSSCDPSALTSGGRLRPSSAPAARATNASPGVMARVETGHTSSTGRRTSGTNSAH